MHLRRRKRRSYFAELRLVGGFTVGEEAEDNGEEETAMCRMEAVCVIMVQRDQKQEYTGAHLLLHTS